MNIVLKKGEVLHVYKNNELNHILTIEVVNTNRIKISRGQL